MITQQAVNNPTIDVFIGWNMPCNYAATQPNAASGTIRISILHLENQTGVSIKQDRNRKKFSVIILSVSVLMDNLKNLGTS